MRSLKLRDFDRFIEESFGVFYGHAYNSGFPYFNITEKTGDKERKIFIVDVALAGYTAKELEVYIEGNSLCIEGNKTTEINNEYISLYKGITNKSFSRKIAVPNETIIESAQIKNGILTVQLVIEPKKNLIKIKEVTDG